MNKVDVVRRLVRGSTGAWLLLFVGCSSIFPAAAPPPRLFGLDSVGARVGTSVPTPSTLPANAPTLLVSVPRASAGFDSRHIVYMRAPHQLEYFAHNEWVDTPARMLAPLIVDAIGRSGAFRAVGSIESGVSGELRLETEILSLQQEFDSVPSRVRFTLRVYLIDNATNDVVASRDFDQAVLSASEDPYGGVVAADRVIQEVLAQLAGFCADAVRGFRPR